MGCRLLPFTFVSRYEISSLCHSFLHFRPLFSSSFSSLSSSYHFDVTEEKWQKRWRESPSSSGLDVSPLPLSSPSSSPSSSSSSSSGEEGEHLHFYSLVMFPYPSGALHMGHVRVYTLSDCLTRYRRMKIKAKMKSKDRDDPGMRTRETVLFPMGFDAFGLPAENAAMAHLTTPQEWTEGNIERMKAQMRALALSFDWRREVRTCDATYYRETQRIFLWLFRDGLAYRKRAMVNWDPLDQTVLANEQVDAQGRSWRSGAKVEQKALEQWFVRITRFAESLLSGLDSLDEWPSQVKVMQKNWIGKSEGALVLFDIQNMDAAIEVFTTRVDTLYGVSYLVLAPEHPLIRQIVREENNIITREQRHRVLAYQQKISNKSNQQRIESGGKTGVDTGLYALHPLTQQPLPMFVSEYVLLEYATGAVMGVPAHDERDYAFATRHGLAIVRVVQADDSSLSAQSEGMSISANEGEGRLVNSGEFSGLFSVDARHVILKALQSRQRGKPSVQYRLKDWLVSRQRYWGTPIPIIHCPSCGVVPVPEQDLPVILPILPRLSAKGGSPLASVAAAEWRKCTCPKCHKAAQRETDTLDTFVDSSWYFLRFITPHHSQPFDTELVKPFMPVHLYVGGIEHAILHLLYARFFTHFFHSIGLLEHREPFKRLLTQGMVQGLTYRHPRTEVPIPVSQVVFENGQPRIVDGAEKLTPVVVWEKMSKSKFNGVEPGPMIDKYGADVIRLFMLFKVPPEKALDWDERAVVGQVRWIQRVHSLLQQHVQALQQAPIEQIKRYISTTKVLSTLEHQLDRETAVVISETSKQLEAALVNVAVALLMKFTNYIQASVASETTLLLSPVLHSSLRIFGRMLAPFAPHFASEMFECLVQTGSRVYEQRSIESVSEEEMNVFLQPWPSADSTKLVQEVLLVTIAICGKKVSQFEVDITTPTDQETLTDTALRLIKSELADRPIQRVIFVPSRNQRNATLNFVV